MQPENSDNIKGFDFTATMNLLVDDIINTHPVFDHIILKNILIAISTSNGRKNGVVAKMRPMRFEGGLKTKTLHGIEFVAPAVNIKGNSILYIVYFHLPRFQNHGNQNNKLTTVLHELYHISPQFNGDVRRFSGKNYAHSSSRKKYDEMIDRLTDEYIQKTSHPELSLFLKYNYSELKRKFGSISGDMVRIPRSRPVVKFDGENSKV